MSFFSAIRVALGALFVNKVRSTLTSLGIVIGISAVIALVSAGDGARLFLDDRLDSLGKNLILIRAGARNQQGMIADFAPLPAGDADALRKRLRPLLESVAELQMTQSMIYSAGGHAWSGVVGTTEELQEARRWVVRPGGRFLTRDDAAQMAPVCVLGETVRRKLFPDDRVVGKTVRVGLLQLQIVGLLEAKGRSLNGGDQDDQIFVPLSTLQHKMGGGEKISMILVSVRTEALIEKAKAEILKVMRERRHAAGKRGPENFDVSSVQEVAELAVVVTDTLHVLVLVVASISLVVGGIGVMNIMLVSVTERTREIGIRMAVGATPRDVLTQFLIEAVVLAMVGGVLGILLGVAAAVAMHQAVGWPLSISPSSILAACGVSAAVGIAFGFYPAWKASRMDPIEALRYE
jgi:putative ABC transport system permease protein